MIINQDILEWCRQYKGPKFHSLLCDPPYHLTSITERFGKEDSAPAKGGVYNRSAKGFMGQQWDGGDIAFHPETWQALREHLFPGAFGMAFASSRGWHRLAVAIEDAGFIIHPSIFLWTYGSGFPKATRIDTQVDKAAGVSFEETPAAGVGFMNPEGRGGWNVTKNRLKRTGNSTSLAQTWSGHRYGLQALKPAAEPIICFQKPYEGKPVDSIVKTGAGALNIDGARIPVDGSENRSRDNSKCKTDDDYYFGKTRVNQEIPVELGRWPANFVLVHHPECGEECHEDCVVKKLGNKEELGEPVSRFFYNADWELDKCEPVFYEPKADRKEREAGLENLESKTRHRVNAGGLEHEPRFAPTEMKNHHPTVKPLKLNKWLATLLLPPVEYTPRRILVPFAGVGSEMIGAILAGWDEVIGIEQSLEYTHIGNTRIEWWSKWVNEISQNDVGIILSIKEDENQIKIF